MKAVSVDLFTYLFYLLVGRGINQMVIKLLRFKKLSFLKDVNLKEILIHKYQERLLTKSKRTIYYF